MWRPSVRSGSASHLCLPSLNQEKAMTEKKNVSRRDFIQTTGAAAGALATAGTFAHPAIGSIKGANDRINFAVLGAGGRATSAHVAHLTHMKEEGKAVDIIG